MADDQAKRTAPEPSDFTPARFALVYESKDGRLCIFEDADGHLTAVRASKLA